MQRKIFSLFILGSVLLTGCNNKKPDIPKTEVTTGNISVIHETKFDSVYGNLTIDQFMAKGFELGDSVTVSFSTGFTYNDIPLYDGYYVKTGEPLVVAYPGYPYIDVATNNKGELWQNLGLTENDTMSIVLNEKGKYLTEQETFSMKYYDDRERFSSDEVFSNFRPMNLSTMNENTFYRGASPVDNQHNRASCSDGLINNAGIKFILNLADSKEEVESYIAKDDFASPYSLGLYNSDDIAYLNMGVDFTAPIFQEKLVSGLKELIKHEGPYYIHCTEGKDRTGFVCFFLEALSGASYEELENDYMITYFNYYGINKENNKNKYDAVVNLRFRDFVNFLTPTNDGSYLGDRSSVPGLFTSNKSSLKDAAIDFLISGGMSEMEIATLQSLLTK